MPPRISRYIFVLSLAAGLFWTLGMPLDPIVEGSLVRAGVPQEIGYLLLLLACGFLAAALAYLSASPLSARLRTTRFSLWSFLFACVVSYLALGVLIATICWTFLPATHDRNLAILLLSTWLPLWYAPAGGILLATRP